VRLPGGRGLFCACESGIPAAAILSASGLLPGPYVTIDPAAEVTLTMWSRP
jgi:hypothetical protein